MDDSIKRLLFTEEPFTDESFIGYAMRLADLNEIPELPWILKLGGLRQLYDRKYRFTVDFKVDPQRLSTLTGTDVEKLKELLYRHEHNSVRNIVGNLLVFGQPLPHQFVQREKPKICPACLIESKYCRKVWELAPVTACPHHRCLLLDQCLKCQRKINWTRPKVNVCHCEFDFRESNITRLDSRELQLTEYLYQCFGLPCLSKKRVLKYPLNELTVENLLTLLFFFAAPFAGILDYTGVGIAKYKNNEEIHEYLCRAMEVFDDWMESFYNFIEAWRKQEKKYFINCKVLYLSKIALPREYSQYELFNQLLHMLFEEEQFGFLHKAFAKFLEKLPKNDPSSVTSLAAFFTE